MSVMSNSEFQQEGYIVRRGFFSSEEMEELKSHIDRLIQSNAPLGNESSARMRFYHNLFRKDDYFRKFSCQKKIVDLIASIIGPTFWIRWDHSIVKEPGGEGYPWHQDNAYSGVHQPYCQLWIAVTDSTREQGGISFIEKSHLAGLQPYNKKTNRVLSETPAGKEIHIEAKQGDILVFSSLMLHRTLDNVSNRERWTHIIEYVTNHHFEPGIKPPYFFAAKNNLPHGKFVYWYKGNLNPMNHYRYMKKPIPGTKYGVKSVIKRYLGQGS